MYSRNHSSYHLLTPLGLCALYFEIFDFFFPLDSPVVGKFQISVKSLIIIRLDYYLTSILTKIATVTRTSQATAPQSTGLPYKSVRRRE